MNDAGFARRCKVVELLFEEYVSSMPAGGPVPPRDQWPDGFVEAMADSPPIRDLDARIAFGAKVLTAQTIAAWQAGTS
jgi:hypothetical protein